MGIKTITIYAAHGPHFAPEEASLFRKLSAMNKFIGREAQEHNDGHGMEVLDYLAQVKFRTFVIDEKVWERFKALRNDGTLGNTVQDFENHFHKLTEV